MIRLETYYRSLIFNNKQVSMKEILDVSVLSPLFLTIVGMEITEGTEMSQRE